jgi:cyclopropane-fatty-acyl-phospholipid synthase
VTRGDFPTRLAKRIFLKTLEEVRSGCLELACSDGVYTFGNPAVPPQATVFVHDDRFFARALFGADVGIGESYMDGEWTSPNVADVVRFGIRNLLSARIEKRIFLNRGRSDGWCHHHRRRRLAAQSIDGTAFVIIAEGVSWVNYPGA